MAAKRRSKVVAGFSSFWAARGLSRIQNELKLGSAYWDLRSACYACTADRRERSMSLKLETLDLSLLYFFAFAAIAL